VKLEWADAVRQVQRLALLRFFPVANEEALKALAEELQDWCTGTVDKTPLEQAQALVKRALREPEWLGIGELRSLFDRMYAPRPEGFKLPDWPEQETCWCGVKGCFIHLEEAK
jgi:hypothetical protein